MKIEDQICTLLQAERLNELGVIQGKSIFYYDTFPSVKFPSFKIAYNRNTENPGYFYSNSCFSAFTVAELSVMLLEYAETYFSKNGTWRIGDADADFDTQAEASADRLIYILENDIITVEEVNNRLTK